MRDGTRLVVEIGAADEADADHLDQLTQVLRGELLDLDVDAVEPVPESQLPVGAKGSAAMAGWLAVLFGTPDLLPTLISVIGDWAGRNHRTVRVSIGSDVLEVTSATSAQQSRIIEAWLERQSTGA